MKSDQVALNLGTPPGSPPRTSSEFEEVAYPQPSPPSHWAATKQDAELPLHYMSEESARRRVRGQVGTEYGDHAEAHELEPLNDDEGKDVYNKIGATRPATYGGRPRKPVHPPPSSLVRSNLSKEWSGAN